MTGERYTLDANILFYALNADVSHKHEIAKQLWRGALLHDCVVTLQAMAETYNVVIRKRPVLAEESYRMLTSLALFVPVVVADMVVFAEAMKSQRERHTQFWNTMLWATAKRHDCKVILTEDMQDLPQVGGVRYLDPFRASLLELKAYL